MRFWRAENSLWNLGLDCFGKVKLLLRKLLILLFSLCWLSGWSIFWPFDFFICVLSLNLRWNFWYSYGDYSRCRHYSKLVCKNLNLLVNIQSEHWSKLSRMVRIHHCIIFLWIEILDMVVLIKKFACFIYLVNYSLNCFWVHILFHCLDFIYE